MSKQEEFLNSLTEEQRALFLSMNEPAPKKRGRPAKAKTETKKKNVGRIELDKEDDDYEDFDEEEDYTPSKRARREPKKGARAARVVPFTTGPRPNKFEEMYEFNLEKQYVEEDKEALKKSGVRPRGQRTTQNEVQCRRCRRWYIVGGILGHENYICDNCIPGRE